MRTHLDYALMDPTGNITLLVETPVPPEAQPLAAARLMEAEPSAEQVGFLAPAPGCDLALRMAGGEFCGNASLSAAALWAMDRRSAGGDVLLRVSGAPGPVRVSVSPLPEGGCRGTVVMPPPLAVEQIPLPDGGALPVVRFDGIAHAILERAPDRASAEAQAPLLCRRLDAEALGLLFLDREAGTMTPLVYVPGAGTLCWETSCASGTAAAAVYLARESGGPVTVSLRQPGGILTAAADPEGELTLTGTAFLKKRDSVALSL